MRNIARKVLFLYPHSVVEGQLIDLLVQAEFEVAVLKDHEKALRLIHELKGSILYVNIEEQLPEEEWDNIARTIVQGADQHNCALGVLVYNNNPETAQRYLMDIGISCGFIQLKLGVTESAKIILKALMANGARGDRKYVRVRCPEGKASLNIKMNGRSVDGKILDISSAGFAATLEQNLEVGTELDDIQLSLRGSIVRTSGILRGIRNQDEGGDISVVMFNEISPNDKSKLYTFIRKTLQDEIDTM